MSIGQTGISCIQVSRPALMVDNRPTFCGLFSQQDGFRGCSLSVFESAPLSRQALANGRYLAGGISWESSLDSPRRRHKDNCPVSAATASKGQVAACTNRNTLKS